jgi:hypothetical protein
MAPKSTNKQTNKLTPWPLVRERTIPTDRPPLVGEILVSTFVDRGVSRGQRGGSPTVVNHLRVHQTVFIPVSGTCYEAQTSIRRSSTIMTDFGPKRDNGIGSDCDVVGQYIPLAISGTA